MRNIVRGLRFWALSKLIGKMQVAANIEIRGTLITHMRTDSFVSGVTINAEGAAAHVVRMWDA